MPLNSDGKLGERCLQKRKEKNLSQKEVADKIGVTQAIIQKIEVNQVKQPKCLLALAKLYDTTPEYLMCGQSFADVDHRSVYKKIPILEWNEAARWCEPSSNNISSQEKKFIENFIDGEKSNYFALKIDNPDFSKSFPMGSMIILEPVDDLDEIQKGQYGLFYDEVKGFAYIRKVVVDSEKFLRPLNPGLPWETLKQGIKGLAKIICQVNILDSAYNI